VKFWLEQLVLPQSQADWENFEVFKGVVGAITSGTATDAGTQVNGIRQLLRVANAASKTNKVVLGAPPTDPVLFVEYMETFYKSIPELHRNVLDGFSMSTTLRDRFKEGMRKKYNSNYAQVGSLVTIIDSSVQVGGYASHAGSDMIWTTIKGNKALGVKKPQNETVFKIEESKREVVAMTDFYKGLGFWYYPYVYHNDRDLV
jgi:putative N-acetylmannosamine-6-phosphate epimerase